MYELVYTDPPWPVEKGNRRKCRPNQGKELDYNTLTVEEIFEIQKLFFSNTAEKHNVFMWSVDKFLHETEIEMSKLGYKLHSRLIWNKQNGVAPAFTVRFSHEYLLWFYRKGHMLRPDDNSRGKYMSVFSEPTRVHSKKPIFAYEMLEDMFPGCKKIELFARNKRDGWDSWGNEIDTDIAVPASLVYS